VYHERAAGFPQDLAEHNAGDAFGAMFFLLVDFAGANQTTPSGEGNPATSTITRYTVEYDARVESYASCDLIVGSTEYKCACNHERQLNKTSPCSLRAVGKVDMKPYYKSLKALAPARNAPAPANAHETADTGCSWFDTNRCQINLGKKLSSGDTSLPFTWFSFPRAVENSKWKVTSTSKPVHAYCLIDAVATKLAPSCKGSCGQTLPSGGDYNSCFFNCFFEAALGSGWNTGTAPPTSGTTPSAFEAAFEAAFGAC
jgi:hypothetical protein